jgi:outer membrane protein OmpA-like peptidoglycan-associated protein
MQGPVTMKQQKHVANSTRSAFIGAISVLLAAGCTTLTLPSRELPHELGVKQVPGRDESHPTEYVFCDINGGAWACETVTPKTPIQTLSVEPAGDQPMTRAVHEAIKSLPVGPSRDSVPTVAGAAAAMPTTPGNQATQNKASPIAVIHFDFNSLDLKADAKLTLLEVLGKVSGKTVALHGYTDSLGNTRYNRELSLRRANAVKAFFETAHTTAAWITTFGHGSCCTAVPNGTEAQRAENRRVEIVLID